MPVNKKKIEMNISKKTIICHLSKDVQNKITLRKKLINNFPI